MHLCPSPVKLRNITHEASILMIFHDASISGIVTYSNDTVDVSVPYSHCGFPPAQAFP